MLGYFISSRQVTRPVLRTPLQSFVTHLLMLSMDELKYMAKLWKWYTLLFWNLVIMSQGRRAKSRAPNLNFTKAQITLNLIVRVIFLLPYDCGTPGTIPLKKVIFWSYISAVTFFIIRRSGFSARTQHAYYRDGFLPKSNKNEFNDHDYLMCHKILHTCILHQKNKLYV